jgi:hypothetical protein
MSDKYAPFWQRFATVLYLFVCVHNCLFSLVQVKDKPHDKIANVHLFLNLVWPQTVIALACRKQKTSFSLRKCELRKKLKIRKQEKKNNSGLWTHAMRVLEVHIGEPEAVD